MKKRFFLQLTAFCLAAVLLSGSAALCADPHRDLPVYTIAAGELDADGNMLPERILDENGNEVLSDAVMACASEDLPAAYDVRSLFALTPVKHQAGTGSCWAFTTIACMEASLIRQGYGTADTLDFSEAHLVWFGQRQRVSDPTDPTYGDGRVYDAPFLYGGNWSISAPTILRGSGLQLESNAPWIETYNADEMMQMAQPESDRYVSYARLWSVRSVRQMTDRDRMKQLIMEEGAGMIVYYDDTGYANTGFNKQNNCYYQGIETGKTNHAVTVIGWDDNFSKENFNPGNQPENDGAWLIKGSWSARYGDGGYYYLSYDDPSINAFAVFRAAPKEIYDNIYQYDGAYPSMTFPCPSEVGVMANEFTARDNELLTHVSFYSPNVTVDATVEIYVGGDTYTVRGNDPTAGMQRIDAATTQCNDVLYGYDTVELAQAVPLHKGQHFTVKVTLRSPTGSVNIPVEGYTVDQPKNGKASFGGNPGESFVCLLGEWSDTNNYGAYGNDYNNVPVKAMTRSVPQDCVSLYVQQMPDVTVYQTGDTVDLQGLQLHYTDLWGREFTVTDGYSVDAPALDHVGTVPLCVRYAGLSCTLDITVQRRPGDVTADGTVDLQDVVVLERYLVGGHGVQVCRENADVNADEALSLLDAALIKRVLAGGYGAVLI